MYTYRIAGFSVEEVQQMVDDHRIEELHYTDRDFPTIHTIRCENGQAAWLKWYVASMNKKLAEAGCTVRRFSIIGFGGYA